MVFRRPIALLGQPGQDLSGFVFLARAAQRTGAVQLGILGVVAVLARRRERRRGRFILLLVLLGESPEITGHSQLAGLLQVLKPRLIAAQAAPRPHPGGDASRVSCLSFFSRSLMF